MEESEVRTRPLMWPSLRCAAAQYINAISFLKRTPKAALWLAPYNCTWRRTTMAALVLYPLLLEELSPVWHLGSQELAASPPFLVAHAVLSKGRKKRIACYHVAVVRVVSASRGELTTCAYWRLFWNIVQLGTRESFCLAAALHLRLEKHEVSLWCFSLCRAFISEGPSMSPIQNAFVKDSRWGANGFLTRGTIMDFQRIFQSLSELWSPSRVWRRRYFVFFVCCSMFFSLALIYKTRNSFTNNCRQK